MNSPTVPATASARCSTLSRPGRQSELLRLAESHGDDRPPEPLEQTRPAPREPEPVFAPVAISASASVPKRTTRGELQTNPRRLMPMLDQLHTGEIALPDFQRSFVWAPDATRELIVSLIGAFPAGNLLFMQGGSAAVQGEDRRGGAGRRPCSRRI